MTRTSDLLSTQKVCEILGVTPRQLAELVLSDDLLPEPDIWDGHLWRRATILRFILRQHHDPAFAERVQSVILMAEFRLPSAELERLLTARSPRDMSLLFRSRLRPATKSTSEPIDRKEDQNV